MRKINVICPAIAIQHHSVDWTIGQCHVAHGRGCSTTRPAEWHRSACPRQRGRTRWRKSATNIQYAASVNGVCAERTGLARRCQKQVHNLRPRQIGKGLCKQCRCARDLRGRERGAVEYTYKILSVLFKSINRVVPVFATNAFTQGGQYGVL